MQSTYTTTPVSNNMIKVVECMKLVLSAKDGPHLCRPIKKKSTLSVNLKVKI